MRVTSKATLALSMLIVVGCLLVFATLFGRRDAPDASRQSAASSLQAPVQGAADSPLPLHSLLASTEEIIVITPPPDGGVIVLPPTDLGHIVAFPSPTPFPTRTPRPTPTQRPGPTATAMPLPKPAVNAAGFIYFTSHIDDSQQTIPVQFSIPIDGKGNAAANLEIMDLPMTLDFAPYQVVISPNRRYTLYMQAVEPGVRPNLYNSATGETRILFEDYSGGQFWGWHPDGRHFLFWIDDVGLWLIDAETLEMTTLAYPEGPLQGAAISPDGLTVAYIAKNPPALGAMWFVSAVGSDAMPQFSAGNSSFLYSTAWAPTNDRLIYYGDCPPPAPDTMTSNTASLCLFHRAEQRFQPLNLQFSGYPPNWSPDGRYIAASGFGSNEKPCEKSEVQNDPEKCQYQGRMIYLADITTGDVVPLTPGIAPIWSPDGSKIAFLSDRTGSSELWIIGANGRDEQQLTTIGNYINPRSLAWLPEVQ